mmetsp:Transcript_83610/g.125381  ORF Transcript_83610/g.125381 Transcript_83610/m.125381 type:complete len:216 (-) Transcript_83610:151-798(-)|eukprot:CAMPEP_0117006034 /NCGR_PEP_ID=MMETSP0472-20121206/6415_1 /TAXON_ID=693140 ORGANISM="Tiarina fusus, Strain LIS" /NCGR_SAMPLE_ID=MMETSP0472 /ASSEMBLY_ACC=CAM_ASM_000603 /LENGTH=215 /DNA_ID=CAMNT_0004707401 /DNA_START=70 /DNA_END=717 /DNA_ORIENTATION=+
MPISRRLTPQMVSLLSADLDAGLSSGSTHSQQDCRRAPAKNVSMKKRKSVQFPSGDSLSTLEADAAYELSEDIKNELWWSPEEVKDSNRERKSLVKQFVAGAAQSDDGEGDHSEVEKKIVELYKSCSSMSVSQVLRSKSNKQFLSEVASSDGLRGLEVKLCRTVARHRRQHVQSMLSVIGSGDDELLSGKSMQSSRTSQILARVLAQVDARECAT